MKIAPFNVDVIRTESMPVKDALVVHMGSGLKQASAIIARPADHYRNHSPVDEGQAIYEWLRSCLPATTLDELYDCLRRNR